MKSAVDGELNGRRAHWTESLDELTFFRPDPFSSPGALLARCVSYIRVSIQARRPRTRKIFRVGLPGVSSRGHRDRLADVSFFAIGLVSDFQISDFYRKPNLMTA